MMNECLTIHSSIFIHSFQEPDLPDLNLPPVDNTDPAIAENNNNPHDGNSKKMKSTDKKPAAEKQVHDQESSTHVGQQPQEEEEEEEFEFEWTNLQESRFPLNLKLNIDEVLLEIQQLQRDQQAEGASSSSTTHQPPPPHADAADNDNAPQHHAENIQQQQQPSSPHEPVEVQRPSQDKC